MHVREELLERLFTSCNAAISAFEVSLRARVELHLVGQSNLSKYKQNQSPISVEDKFQAKVCPGSKFRKEMSTVINA